MRWSYLSFSLGRFHQHFTRAFFLWKCFAQLSLDKFQLCNFWHQNIGAKSAPKMLMKLTPSSRNTRAYYRIMSLEKKATWMKYNLTWKKCGKRWNRTWRGQFHLKDSDGTIYQHLFLLKEKRFEKGLSLLKTQHRKVINVVIFYVSKPIATATYKMVCLKVHKVCDNSFTLHLIQLSHVMCEKELKHLKIHTKYLLLLHLHAYIVCVIVNVQ